MSKLRWPAPLGFMAILAILAGCGGGGGAAANDSTNLIGVWSLRSVQVNEEPAVVCGQQGQSAGLVFGCDPGQTVTFYPNGVLQTYNGTDRGQGAWQLNGAQLTLSSNQNQSQTTPFSPTISVTGDQLTATFLDTSSSTPMRYRAILQRTASQPPPFVAVSNPPSFLWSSGSSQPPAINPNPSRPVADYVGTWKGTWTTAGGGGSALQTGTLTLTFDAKGAITGQIVNSTTVRTYPVTGILFVDGTMTSGFNNAAYTSASGIVNSFLGQFFIDTSGQMHAAISLDPLPQDVGYGNVVGVTILTRQ